MKSLIASVSLLALTAAAPVLAQTASTTAPSATGQMGARQMLSQQDQTFVREAAAGGIAEVETGKLAVQRAAEPAIREFGRWMATDHELVNAILANIARNAGVTPPQAPDQEHQAMMRKLQALQGEQFDGAYIPAQVQGHQEMIQLFQTEAKSGQDARLRIFATRIVPVLEQHLAEAEELQKLPAMASTGSAVGSGSSMPPRTGTGGNEMTRRLNRQELNRTQSTQ